MKASLYVAYSSEDGGHRFSVGKPYASLKELRGWLERHYLPKMMIEGEDGILYRSRKELTSQQIQNASPPDTHGEVVGMYALDGTWSPLASGETGYRYDWIFLIKLES